MRIVTGSGNLPYSRRRGLMILKGEFRQRTVGKVATSMRSRLPLHTPSGAQWVESQLERDLVKQLAFVPNIYDILTQPILDYEFDGKPRTYTPDVICAFQSVEGSLAGRFLIEAKLEGDLERKGDEYRVKFAAAERLAPDMGAAFRVVTEKEIRTPYLTNTLRFARLMQDDPDFGARDVLADVFGTAPFAYAAAVEALSWRFERWLATEHLDRLVAWRIVLADLTKVIDDTSMLEVPSPHDPRRHVDPFLATLQMMDSGVNK